MNGKMKRLLKWMDGKAVLETQIIGSGLSKQLNQALTYSWADFADAGVKDHGVPAAAFTLTPHGRTALLEEHRIGAS